MPGPLGLTSGYVAQVDRCDREPGSLSLRHLEVGGVWVESPHNGELNGKQNGQ